jgi:hypothetical protein
VDLQQRKAKKNFFQFVGFIGVIAILSGGASGYLFNLRTKHTLQRYAFMIKSQGLMLKQRGTQLIELGAVISSYAKSEIGLPSTSSQRKALRKYADEVRKSGEELEKYGGKLIRNIQAKKPEDALATVAEVQLFIPENLNTIKKLQEKIQGLELSALKRNGKIQQLQFELQRCMIQPKAPTAYPPAEYLRYHRRPIVRKP